MVGLKIEDVKGFTCKLFVKDDFDLFLVKEVQIVTFNSFSIDGHIRKGYFSEEELEEIGDEGFAPWKLLRPVCFGLIKGKRLPGSFHIVLQLPAGQVERFASGNGVEAGQIQGMYLNIRYEDGALYCITGLSLGFFTLDKTLEDLWDRSAEEFLRKRGIACLRE